MLEIQMFVVFSVSVRVHQSHIQVSWIQCGFINSQSEYVSLISAILFSKVKNEPWNVFSNFEANQQMFFMKAQTLIHQKRYQMNRKHCEDTCKVRDYHFCLK